MTEQGVTRFKSFGLNCMIRLAPGAGHYCGYVEVPRGHHAFRNEIGDKLRVHGGVTYENWLDDPNDWWIGFDCAHSGDGLNSSEPGWKDFAYVEAEVKSLAKQIAEWKGPRQRWCVEDTYGVTVWQSLEAAEYHAGGKHDARIYKMVEVKR